MFCFGTAVSIIDISCIGGYYAFQYIESMPPIPKFQIMIAEKHFHISNKTMNTIYR